MLGIMTIRVTSAGISRPRRWSGFRARSVALALAACVLPGVAHAEKDRVLFSFNEGLGPAEPQAGPILGPSDKMYFTTINYSTESIEYPGAAVEASLNQAKTAASIKTIHVFTGASGEGAYPSALL